jgi:hypothetical protein
MMEYCKYTEIEAIGRISDSVWCQDPRVHQTKTSQKNRPGAQQLSVKNAFTMDMTSEKFYHSFILLVPFQASTSDFFT